MTCASSGDEIISTTSESFELFTVLVARVGHGMVHFLGRFFFFFWRAKSGFARDKELLKSAASEYWEHASRSTVAPPTSL